MARKIAGEQFLPGISETANTLVQPKHRNVLRTRFLNALQTNKGRGVGGSMHDICSKVNRIAATLLLVMVCCIAAVAGEWNRGTLLVGIGNGKYQVWTTADGTSYALSETITDPSGSGVTFVGGSDATYHLFTANLTNKKVYRWVANADPGTSATAHTTVQTIDTSGSCGGVSGSKSQPATVDVDGSGNIYVGEGAASGGKGLVLKYDLTASTCTTLPVGASNVNTGTKYLAVDESGQNIYFAYGAGSIKWFNVSSSTINTLPNTPSGAKFFGIRILPSATQQDTHGFMLAAAQKSIYLLDSSGVALHTYSVANETDFESVSLDTAGSGGAPNFVLSSFWGCNPTSGNCYRFNIGTGAVEAGPVAVGTGVTSVWTYGTFGAAQAQPQPAVVLSEGSSDTGIATLPNANANYTSNTAAFRSPFPSANSDNFKVTFQCDSCTSAGTVSAFVSEISPAQGKSDKPVVNALTGLTESTNTLDCTPNPNTGSCYMWDVSPRLSPNFTTADASLSQAGVGPQSVLLRKENSDITALAGNSDPAGPTRCGLYSVNQLPTTNGTAGCFYLPPNDMAGDIVTGGNATFKFQCTGLSSQQLRSLDPRLSLTFLPAGAAPHDLLYTTTGNSSGPAPFYRFSAPNTWIINVDVSQMLCGSYGVMTVDATGQIDPLFFAPLIVSGNCVTQ
jgi:hypothetical protein